MPLDSTHQATFHNSVRGTLFNLAPSGVSRDIVYIITSEGLILTIALSHAFISTGVVLSMGLPLCVPRRNNVWIITFPLKPARFSISSSALILHVADYEF